MADSAIEIFFSYSHKDEALRNELDAHLSGLRRSGLIRAWYDRQIEAGSEWAGEIDHYLNSADIILLLVSHYFISSDYCWSIELQRAMERHEAGEACVVPIILSPVDWTGAPFAKLQAFPKDAKPITTWSNRDEAFLNVAQEIRKAVNRIHRKRQQPTSQLTRQRKSSSTAQKTAIQKTDISYTKLQNLLETGKWEEADRETWILMLKITERIADERLRIDDIKRIPYSALKKIDQLWMGNSNSHFGFRVQKAIWQECGSPKELNADWERFCDRVGWRKRKLGTLWTMESISYSEVIYDLKAPRGHIPVWPIWNGVQNRDTWIDNFFSRIK